MRSLRSSRRLCAAAGSALRCDAVVVGGGVVGLAVARALALASRDVTLLEAAGATGTGNSSRSSEGTSLPVIVCSFASQRADDAPARCVDAVVHAGLYYPRGSLKQRLCVAGRDALYAYCAARGVPHARLGKLVVASAAQAPELDALAATAAANGVADLRRLSAAETARLEPAVRAHAALLSPSSGIVDSHALMRALQADAEGASRATTLLMHCSSCADAHDAAAGATVALRSRVVGGEAAADGIRLLVDDAAGGAPAALHARSVVLCAGLATRALARSIGGVDADALPRQHLAKGTYFALRGVATPFSRLVYPLPQHGGLGVHATLDLAGRVRFGPDVQWLPSPAGGDAASAADELAALAALDFRVDPSRAAAFQAAVRQYWPALPDGALVPDYAGIRPKVRALAWPGIGGCRALTASRVQAVGPGRRGGGLFDSGGGAARRAWLGRAARHRVARPHRLPRAGRRRSARSAGRGRRQRRGIHVSRRWRPWGVVGEETQTTSEQLACDTQFAFNWRCHVCLCHRLHHEYTPL